MPESVRIRDCGHAGFAHAHVIGNNAPGACGEGREKVPIEIAPGRIAVQQDKRISFTHIHVVHLKGFQIHIVGRKGKRSGKGCLSDLKHAFVSSGSPDL